MTIKDVIANLDNTIKGKETLASRLDSAAPWRAILDINVQELSQIKADLEKVEAERLADLKRIRDSYNERFGKA